MSCHFEFMCHIVENTIFSFMKERGSYFSLSHKGTVIDLESIASYRKYEENASMLAISSLVSKKGCWLDVDGMQIHIGRGPATPKCF